MIPAECRQRFDTVGTDYRADRRPKIQGGFFGGICRRNRAFRAFLRVSSQVQYNKVFHDYHLSFAGV